MSEQADYSMLDRPEILQFIFYPRSDFQEGPSNSVDYFVPVGDGIGISCRIYIYSKSAPTVIYFHGNGEVVSDYNYVAPTYNEIGINLLVVDYRGYGASGGKPMFVDMTSDAHVVFETLRDILHHDEYTGDFFVMGRSLGSISAIEVACNYYHNINGLILESAFGSIIKMMAYAGLTGLKEIKDLDFPNLKNIRKISVPTLILHGELDNLIPVSEAKSLFKNSAAKDKRLVFIPNAGHNDIMLVGMEQYFCEVREFVFKGK